LLPQSLHLRLQELGLYAKYVLKVLRVAQLLYEFAGGGDVLFGEDF
jgi:hypothetical protein